MMGMNGVTDGRKKDTDIRQYVSSSRHGDVMLFFSFSFHLVPYSVGFAYGQQDGFSSLSRMDVV